MIDLSPAQAAHRVTALLAAPGDSLSLGLDNETGKSEKLF